MLINPIINLKPHHSMTVVGDDGISVPAAPAEKQPTQPQPTKPQPTKPQPTKPVETQPQPTKPQPTKPAVTQPAKTEPAKTQPQVTKPQPTKPAVTQPAPDVANNPPYVPDTSNDTPSNTFDDSRAVAQPTQPVVKEVKPATSAIKHIRKKDLLRDLKACQKYANKLGKGSKAAQRRALKALKARTKKYKSDLAKFDVWREFPNDPKARTKAYKKLMKSKGGIKFGKSTPKSKILKSLKNTRNLVDRLEYGSKGHQAAVLKKLRVASKQYFKAVDSYRIGRGRAANKLGLWYARPNVPRINNRNTQYFFEHSREAYNEAHLNDHGRRRGKMINLLDKHGKVNKKALARAKRDAKRIGYKKVRSGAKEAEGWVKSRRAEQAKARKAGEKAAREDMADKAVEAPKVSDTQTTDLPLIPNEPGSAASMQSVMQF